MTLIFLEINLILCLRDVLRFGSELEVLFVHAVMTIDLPVSAVCKEQDVGKTNQISR